MAANSFRIFIPVRKFYFTANTILYPLVSLFFLPFAYEIFILKRVDDEVSAVSRILFYMSILVMLTGGFLRTFRSSRKKVLKGVVEGSLTFKKESIAINDTVYALEDIQKINFAKYGDYKGRKEDFSTANYNGRVSNGVDNCVVLTLTNGETVTCYFELEERYQMREMRSKLVHYHNEGKLHFLNLIGILGIEDYNAIQIFKKSLPEGGNVKSY